MEADVSPPMRPLNTRNTRNPRARGPRSVRMGPIAPVAGARDAPPGSNLLQVGASGPIFPREARVGGPAAPLVARAAIKHLAGCTTEGEDSHPLTARKRRG